MEQFICPCGYVYMEPLGCPSMGISPGTSFADLPESWHCPKCGLDKGYFGNRTDSGKPVC